MNINQNFGVAIHILTILSLNEKDYITSKELAESINTNPVVVRRILKKLAENDLVITKQGRFGSKLNPNVKEITFLDVYNVFYEGHIIKPTHSPNKGCPIGKNINVAMCEMLDQINTNFENELKKHTINNIKNKMEDLL